MIPKHASWLRVCVSFVLVASAACSGGPSSRKEAPEHPAKSRANCQSLPTASGALEWLPSNLRLPTGTRPVGLVEAQPNEKAGRLAIPLSLKAFTLFVEKSLPKQGYMVVGGDHETHEVDRGIRKGRDVLRFRARDDYCNTKWSAVEVRYFKTGPSCPGGDKPCDYAFEGFLAPISNSKVNTVRAGDPLVISWRLKDPSGQPYRELSAVAASQVQEPAQGAAISLKFEKGLSVQDGTYRLTIFSLLAWKGSTKTVTLFLDDGTAHQARFKFT